MGEKLSHDVGSFFKRLAEKNFPRLYQKSGSRKLCGIGVICHVGFISANLGADRTAQPTVKAIGIRKGLKVFGAIELKGGSFQYQQSPVYALKTKITGLLKETGFTSQYSYNFLCAKIMIVKCYVITYLYKSEHSLMRKDMINK